MEYSIMLLLIFSVISYHMLYVLWIFSMVGMLLNFLICYIFVSMLLLFIISVYLENNIFIIQLFLIIWVSGLLFTLYIQ
jgi:hypothetical protein